MPQAVGVEDRTWIRESSGTWESCAHSIRTAPDSDAPFPAHHDAHKPQVNAWPAAVDVIFGPENTALARGERRGLRAAILPHFQTLLAIAATQMVPFWYGGGFARNNYQWELHNDGRPDNLYSNGVFICSEPGGDYSLHWFSADCSSVKVGLIDTADAHGWFTEGIIFGGAGMTGIASNAVEDFLAEDFRVAAWVPNDIISCVQHGDKVINLPWGESVPDPALSNACQFAADNGVIICCAVPDTGQDIDATPDYPSSWNFWNVLSVTTLARTGQLYQYGIGAHGTNVIGAPGRNVMSFICKGSNVVYTTATSFACPHATGIVAELCALFPDRPAREIVAMIRGSLLPNTNGIAGDLQMPVQPPRPKLSLIPAEGGMSRLSVADDTNYVYVLQVSFDLNHWQDASNLPPLPGGSSVELSQGQSQAFYRVKRLEALP
jgi:hypothetical protein